MLTFIFTNKQLFPVLTLYYASFDPFFHLSPNKMCYSLEFHDSDILILNDLFWLILVPMSNIRIYHECNLVFFPMHFLLMTSSILTILKSIYMLIIPKYLSPVLVNNPILRLICNCLDISVRISNKHFKLNMLEILYIPLCKIYFLSSHLTQSK